MRSKLFVPGSRPELFDKAAAGPADALSFDLEDSVPEARKAEARDTLGAWLAQHGPRVGAAGKTLIVRVNAQDTVHFADDVRATVRPGLHLLNLPKPETVAQVLAAVAALEAAERANGVTQPVGLLLNIETPRALREAHALAGAHPRVRGLQLGLGDLFEPLDIARSDAAARHHVMLRVRLAAGEAGLYAMDGAYPDVADASGFDAEARMARALGFIGKSCIHPSQVAQANAAFQPSAAEIERALRTLAGAQAAKAQGLGAVLVDGRMVDAPFVRRAQLIVDQARQLGLITD